MVKWNVRQALLSTWVWICIPCVPGGKMRFAVTDDFGNLQLISVESASISLGGRD